MEGISFILIIALIVITIGAVYGISRLLNTHRQIVRNKTNLPKKESTNALSETNLHPVTSNVKKDSDSTRIEPKVEKINDRTGSYQGSIEEKPEATLPKVVERDSKSAADNKIPFEKRTGGRRGPRERDSHKEQMETQPRPPEPEIVCWKRERKWEIGIEIPSELFNDDEFELCQQGSRLSRAESRSECWYLKSLSEPIEIRMNGDNETETRFFPKNLKKYGVFKLSGAEQSKGRFVKEISHGAYLFVTPATWSFHRETNDIDIDDEPILLENYKCYYKIFEKGQTRITFIDEMDNQIRLEAIAPLFELVGTLLEDADNDMCLLYGKEPPRIRITGRMAWKEINCIILIEEDRCNGARFIRKILPPKDSDELALGEELKARKAGWYSLRFYDYKEDSPVESFDFRFISEISKIEIHQNSILPSSSGHESISVSIRHFPEAIIQPINKSIDSFGFQREDITTTIVIPPEPQLDETNWLLGSSNGQQVTATFLAERVWWSIGGNDVEPSDWHDTPLLLKREDFNPTTDKSLWIRLPKAGMIDRIYVDFNKENPKYFIVKKDQRTRCISLNNFYDSKAFQNKSIEHYLYAKIKIHDTDVLTIVGKIPPEEFPPWIAPRMEMKEVLDLKSLCHGGKILYGKCRHCRKIVLENK